MELLHSEIPREFLEVLPDGIKYIARQGKNFLVVEEIRCLKGHSLMENDVRIHGEPSIAMAVKTSDRTGSFFLDAFWGSHKKLYDFLPAEGAVLEFCCPVCGESLMINESCGLAGCGSSRYIQLLLPGSRNRVLVCGRLGCPEHRLDIQSVSGRVMEKINEINFFGSQIDDFFGGI